MGFGFNLGLIFIVLPLTAVLLLIWLITRKKVFRVVLILIWSGLLGLIFLSSLLRPFFNKIELDRENYTGEYIIDRSYFAGQQADWQYNHFRFEITENDSIFFHQTEGREIVNTFKGTVYCTTSFPSARLVLRMNEPSHHILSSNPTTYRDIWNFYLVLHSPKFNNMFFKKGQWEPIED